MSENVTESATSEKVASHTPDFAGRVLESVTKAIDWLFGEPSREIIFWNLNVTRGLRQDQIGDEPAAFIEGMRGIFGDSPAKTLESILVRQIRGDFGLSWEKAEETFEEILCRAKETTALLA